MGFVLKKEEKLSSLGLHVEATRTPIIKSFLVLFFKKEHLPSLNTAVHAKQLKWLRLARMLTREKRRSMKCLPSERALVRTWR
jgi:hypothetical protein